MVQVTFVASQKYNDFSHKLCLVGFRNSGCEHKGSHSREIPKPPGPAGDPCPVRA